MHEYFCTENNSEALTVLKTRFYYLKKCIPTPAKLLKPLNLPNLPHEVSKLIIVLIEDVVALAVLRAPLMHVHTLACKSSGTFSYRIGLVEMR